MFEFFKKKFFFRINREEKEFVRHRVMNHDHMTYIILLLIIMFLQLIMFVMSFGGDKADNIVIPYRVLYIFLFCACLITLIFLQLFHKQKKPLPYYWFVSFMMLSFMAWGAGISIIDSISHGAMDLLYFTISIIATALFITIEPWVSLLAIMLVGVAYIIVDVTYVNALLENHLSVGFWIAVPTIMVLGIVGSSFNFIRRVSAIKLEGEVSKLNSVLEGKAYIDDLTKVFNRRYLTENIDVPLTYGEIPSGVMMIDIDHFKKINDNYGHQVGDRCLSRLGLEINDIIKGHDAYCVRYGGEEFLIFYRSIDSKELETIGEEFRRRIENCIIPIPGGNSLNYSVSIGLASASKRISYNHLINNADKALYKAKETRNTVILYKE